MKKVKKIFKKTSLLILATFMVLAQFSPSLINEVEAATLYGVVNFNTKGDATTNYTNAITGEAGYLNGSVAADGAFLGYNAARTQVKFKMSGVIGWVNTNEVEVVDHIAKWDSVSASNYKVENGILKHTIMRNIYSYSAGSTISVGPAPSYLQEGKLYWSYDGHYFYLASGTTAVSQQGYKNMIEDYITGTNSRAINASNPHYNYYQYLSHRTISNYTKEDIRTYLNSLGYNKVMTSYPATSGSTLFYNEEGSFVEYQSEFGVNLGLAFGVARNESAMGTSKIAFDKNNLFGHSAFDASPGASANSYTNPGQSIYVHTKKFISQDYLDPCDYRDLGGNGYNSSVCHLGRYYGSNLGDKASGVGVKYASDPYWGEKAAANYYALDKALGMQDYNKYTIGIKVNSTNVGIYKTASTSGTLLYESGTLEHYPVVILETVVGTTVNGSNKWYKIQTDPVLDSSGSKMIQDNGAYDYKTNVGYVHSSYFIVTNTGKATKNTYKVSFNPSGGIFRDGVNTTKNLTVEEYVMPTISTPTKSGDIFLGWDKEVSPATENITYTAVWKNSTTKYNVTYNCDGGLLEDGNPSKTYSVVGNTMPTVPKDPTKDGYTFVGWTPQIALATKDITYKALWQKDIVYYDVTYDTSGGLLEDGNQTKTYTTKEGEMPVIPKAPTRKGYIFDGWDPEVVVTTKNTVYKAKWKAEVTYEIVFDADGGTFNDLDTKTIYVAAGEMPSILETPTKEGYVFTGWTPTIVKALSNTTYKATWRKGNIEDFKAKKDGEFYLEYLKKQDGKLTIKGYNTITGIDNVVSTDIKYMLVLENIDDSNKKIELGLNRIDDSSAISFAPYSKDGKDYTYSWFDGEIDFTNVNLGDYYMYVISYTEDSYSKNIVNNKLLNKQDTNYEKDGKYVTIYNDYINSSIPVALRVRDKQTGVKETNAFTNQYSMYDTIEFTNDNKLHIKAASYSVGLDMGINSNLKRTLIFENISNYETYTYNVGSITNGPYAIRLLQSDGYGKDKAWFDTAIDISHLPKGTYSIHLSNESNIKDYDEFNELLLRPVDSIKKIINGKTYSFSINSSRRFRIELVVE